MPTGSVVTIPRVSRRWLLPALVASGAALVVGAAAAAAFESDTVGSYGRGLLWAVSLMTTVGFVGRPPASVVGAGVSVALMVTGFLLLSLVSAALASLFVRQDEAPVQVRELAAEEQILLVLSEISDRLARLEEQSDRPPLR